MVDLLGRVGLLEEALDLMKSMPMEPTDIIWGSFLSACRKHKNVKLGRFAEEKMAQLIPERVGVVHVLLSNIYASAEKWSDVANEEERVLESAWIKLNRSSRIDSQIHLW